MAGTKAQKTLSEAQFQRLVKELRGIMSLSSGSAAKEKALGYWQIGQRIHRERTLKEAGYHNAVLRDLAQAVGLSQRTLQRTVQFFLAYPEQPSFILTWAHYRHLAPLPSKTEKRFYEKKTRAQNWSAPQLGQAIKADLYSGPAPQSSALERPPEAQHLYASELVQVIDADTLDVDIDLGFQTWTRKRLRLAGLNAPEPSSPNGREARKFVISQLRRSKTLVIQTEKVGTHGRYIAHVFFSRASLTVQECFAQGNYLNARLIEAQHAQPL